VTNTIGVAHHVVSKGWILEADIAHIRDEKKMDEVKNRSSKLATWDFCVISLKINMELIGRDSAESDYAHNFKEKHRFTLLSNQTVTINFRISPITAIEKMYSRTAYSSSDCWYLSHR